MTAEHFHSSKFFFFNRLFLALKLKEVGIQIRKGHANPILYGSENVQVDSRLETSVGSMIKILAHLVANG